MAYFKGKEMKGKVIRYKKPEWVNWVEMVVSVFEYDAKVKELKELGYLVEGKE